MPIEQNQPSHLDVLVQQALAALSRPAAEEEAPEPLSMRDRFMELLVVALANLHGKMPIPVSPFERSVMRIITEGLDDSDASKFSQRADDWIRLEGLVRVQEGQKNYTLNRVSLSVLSAPTSQGTLGEMMERIAAAYPAGNPSLNSVARPEVSVHTS